MSRDPAQDRPIAERVRPGRVLAEYGVALSRLATEISTGTTVVLKELPAGEVNAPTRGSEALRVDEARPADPGRARQRCDPHPPPLRRRRNHRCLGARILLHARAHARDHSGRASGPGHDARARIDARGGQTVERHRRSRRSGMARRSRAHRSGGRCAGPSRVGHEVERLDGRRSVPPPEQAGVLEGPIDARSDLYSVGVLLFESLTGRPLHGARDTGELFRAQVVGASSSIRAAGVTAPRALDDVVGRLLQKDPRDRYATAAGVLQDLLEIERSLDRGDPNPPLVIGLGDQRTTLTEPGLVGRADEIARIDAAIAGAGRGQGRSSDSKPDPEMGSRGSSTRPPWAPSSAANGSSGRKHTSSRRPGRSRCSRASPRRSWMPRPRTRRTPLRSPNPSRPGRRSCGPCCRPSIASSPTPRRSITPRWSAGSRGARRPVRCPRHAEPPSGPIAR